MFRVHDVLTGFDGLYLSGLKHYSDRALILPGVAVVNDGDIDYHVQYLRDVGIGASRVIKTHREQIVRELDLIPEAVDALRAHVAEGGRVQFFSTTEYEHTLMELLDIPWSKAFNPPAALSKEANSKSALRRLGVRLGLNTYFPEFRIVPCLPEQVTCAVEDIRESPCDFIVLKRPDLASGDGMILVPREGDSQQWIEKYIQKHYSREIIVEAGWRHVPMSVQWEVESDNIIFACASAQLIDATFEHTGNIIASKDIPRVTESDIKEMMRMSFPIVDEYRKRGYVGVCGFDFMKSLRDDRMYLLECNGRITATTYAYGVTRQLVDDQRLREWAAIVCKVEVRTTGVATVRGIHRKLGRRLFDGTTGTLPFNVRLLDSDRPQFAVCCIGNDAEEATVILRDVKRRFGC